jgi:hypothetical protein
VEKITGIIKERKLKHSYLHIIFLYKYTYFV